MRLGLDGGYYGFKGIASTNGGEVRRFWFPSVAGTADESRFGLAGEYQDGGLVEVDGKRWLYGQPAVDLSRHTERKEKRDWYHSDAYRVLVAAALAEATNGTSVEMDVVTGLPLRYYDDRKDLRELLVGEHVVKLGDRDTQRIRVRNECRVVGQPFGTFLAEALTDDGQLCDDKWRARHGVIDVGGHTTNILSVLELQEVRRESASLNVGGWKLVASMREFLAIRCPDLDLRDHEIARVIINGGVNYGPQWVDLTEAVALQAAPLADEVVSIATQQWNGAMQMHEILVTGGGAYLLGPAILAAFPRNARVVDDPVYGNAIGYWKLAGRK